jgi:hypothetical protein
METSSAHQVHLLQMPQLLEVSRMSRSWGMGPLLTRTGTWQGR